MACLDFSCLCVCLWFYVISLITVFPFDGNALHSSTKWKQKGCSKLCVGDCQMKGKYCALYFMHLCVWGWVLWKSSNENNYDSMRICCLSNRRVKNVFCVIFVNLTFDSFWFTLFFSASKDWFSVWVCF